MITKTDICPVPSYENKYSLRMCDLPLEYKQWLHMAEWLPWRFPEVKEYLDAEFGTDRERFLPRINAAISTLFFDKFITYPAESQCIQALMTASQSKNALEVGMWNGFTTLHMIRAAIPHGKVTSIDIHDRRAWKIPDGLGNDEVLAPPRTHDFVKESGMDDLFFELERLGYFRFVHGKTPEIIPSLNSVYDFVFVDSDHSDDHTEKEMQALLRVTKVGTIFVFHDVGDTINDAPLGKFVRANMDRWGLKGWTFPTCMRMDSWHTMGLGIFIRVR